MLPVEGVDRSPASRTPSVDALPDCGQRSMNGQVAGADACPKLTFTCGRSDSGAFWVAANFSDAYSNEKSAPSETQGSKEHTQGNFDSSARL